MCVERRRLVRGTFFASSSRFYRLQTHSGRSSSLLRSPREHECIFPPRSSTAHAIQPPPFQSDSPFEVFPRSNRCISPDSITKSPAIQWVIFTMESAEADHTGLALPISSSNANTAGGPWIGEAGFVQRAARRAGPTKDRRCHCRKYAKSKTFGDIGTRARTAAAAARVNMERRGRGFRAVHEIHTGRMGPVREGATAC